jgi:Fe-coproporphyrin III synthase
MVNRNSEGERGALWKRLRFYASYGWRFVVLRRAEPLIYGIALTDRCNLACRGCRVSNTGRRDMTWEEVVAALRNAWARGYRELYFSGGEPARSGCTWPRTILH